MLGGLNRNGRVDGIDAAEVNGDLPDAGQPLKNLLPSQVPQVKVHVLVMKAAAFVDFSLDGPGDDVPRRQLHGAFGVPLHEPLAAIVHQVASFAARPLADENVGAVEGGGMVLHELQVLNGNARLVSDGDARSGVDQGVAAARKNPAVAAGCQHHHPRRKGLEPAGGHLHGNHPVDPAIVNRQGEGKPLLVHLDAELDTLLVEGVQYHVAGAVRRIAAAGITGAAEGPLGDRPVLQPAPGTAPVLQLVHQERRLGAHHPHRGLVRQVVAALDGVEGVLLNGVVLRPFHVGQGGIHSPLRGDGMGADRVHLA